MLRALRRGRLSGRFQFKEPTPVRIPLQYRLLCRTYVQQLLRMFHNPWQPDRECRAATDLAFDCDVAAHHLAEPAADGEAEAGATVLTRGGRGCLGKLLEQLTHLLRRHADAGVGERERDPVAAILLSFVTGDGDGAFLGKLVGVARK